MTGHPSEKHLANLSLVLEAGLKLNRSKCAFLATKVQYLGFVIDKEALHPTEAKVKAITEAPTPRNVSQLKAFLGLLNYCGWFLLSLW